VPLDKQGFTLIETIVVMVIIIVLTAVMIVKNPFSAIKVYSATRKVAADIRYAQQLANSTQTRCGIQYTIPARYVVFINNAPATPARSAGDPCSDSGGNFIVDFSASQCSNYNGVSISHTLPLNIVKFDSMGTPYDGNNVLLASGGNTVTLSHSGAASRTITIEAGTGNVRY
jgi:type II secretory pathway pseudopilin PulG